jgi:predicted GH43/DUF377 family glycosyl hydrolase
VLKRLPIDLKPDMSRVVCLPYNTENEKSVHKIYSNVLSLNENELQKTYDDFMEDFSFRHKFFMDILENAYQLIEKRIPASAQPMSDVQKKVLASYFLKEFSIETAALFNPSIVVHPVQDNPKKTKILMSLRATGEGHISSIEFVEGYIGADGSMELVGRKKSCSLPCLDTVSVGKSEIQFDESLSYDEQVIFPLTPDESNGIEDVRFVQFADDYGQAFYYGTFTAYDGVNIKSKLIQTEDFKKFSIDSMNGAAIDDKGMALFPKKINGQYAMISRQGGEDIRIMFSDDICSWESSELLLRPQFPWQFGKLGNCGSPIETDNGWLVLTHGVGPIRKYMIGAILLDKNDPRKVIGQTKEAILSAKNEEREGYVPNVVYSCGGLLVNKQLFIPFAVSDISSSVVSVDVDVLINSMK